MRKLYFTILLAVISFGAIAQNRLLFNHYLTNPETFNPGYMDIQTEFRATLLYRMQYLSQPGSPQDGYFNTSYHLHKNHGIGLTVNNQNMSKFNLFEAGVNYVYHAWINNYMAVGIGLNVNYYQQSFNPSSYTAQSMVDPVFGAERSIKGVNFGFGASLQSKNLTVNVSFPRFFANAVVDADSRWKTQFSSVYLSGSYNFEVNKYFSLMPAVLVRATGGAPFNLLIDMNALFNSSIIVGVGYKTKSSIHARIGYQFDFGMRVSYDFETPPFSKATGMGTSHELCIGYYSLFSKPGFDKRKVMTPNGKVKGMRVRKYKGSEL